LGQHFLVSNEWAARIVAALGDASQGTVLEIGPGRGILTSLLAKTARRLIAVELDRVLAAQLRLKFGMAHNVEIIEGDILAIDFDSLFGPKPGLGRPGIEIKPQPVKVIGNLPYYITSPILHHLFRYASLIDEMHFVIQSEVATRLAASPGTRDYGYLSVVTQFYTRPEIVFEIPRQAFQPAPEVTSALVTLRLPGERTKLALKDETRFLNFVKLSFSQKRKTLVNNLRSLCKPEKIRGALARLNLRPDARAEQLTVAQLAAFHARLEGG
jgi:16S rRNA (adenine1518-N6/adenine1519-N6)-dimethyltransferase